jgi:hypothetical protein
MKKISLLTLAVITALTFSSCKKSSSGGAPNQWTLNGTTYKGIITSNEFGFLSSLDASGNAADISFVVTPTANGTYTVTDGSGSDASDCSLEIETASGDGWASTGKAGDKVTVTVSGGKITASFSGVTVESLNTQAVTTTSGTLVQTQ